MRMLRYALAALFFLGVAQAQIIGGGVFYGGSAPSSYQGPGDVASGAIVFGSCARAYNAAYANGTNPLCDVVAVTGGAAVCTLRVATTGFVDLTAYCPGSLTPMAACAAASGGSCVVTKFYDQTGHSNHMTQATLSSMPGLVFSMLGGLPGVNCNTPASNMTLSTTNTITQAQPFAYIGVAQRGTSTDSGAIFGTLGVAIQVMGGISAGANSWTILGTASNATGTVTDASFHAGLGQFNTTSTLYADGSSVASGSLGTTGLSSSGFRICRGNAAYSANAKVMEAGLWPADESANAAALSTNQHSATNGYNF